MYKQILETTDHRDLSVPKGPWVMTQKWNDLLFMHLPVSQEALVPYLPHGLELDTYDGKGWITIIPFKITNMRLRASPPLPFVHAFLELNVRTYVKRDGRSGIYFFSMDADSIPAVLGARVAALPYYLAKMSMKKRKNMMEFESVRKGEGDYTFKGAYLPHSEAYYLEKESLGYWLLERYHLWTYRNGTLYRGDTHHKPWKVNDVEVYISKQTVLPSLPNNTENLEPIFHYATSKRVLFWPFQKEGAWHHPNFVE